MVYRALKGQRSDGTARLPGQHRGMGSMTGAEATLRKGEVGVCRRLGQKVERTDQTAEKDRNKDSGSRTEPTQLTSSVVEEVRPSAGSLVWFCRS